jgi:hypothetical protein
MLGRLSIFLLSLFGGGGAYRFCIHCRHHLKPLGRGIEAEPVSQCRLIPGRGYETVDLVSGRRTIVDTVFMPCWVARGAEGMCGVNGSRFESRDE